MRRGSASFARVRAQAPGFKPGAQRRVHELMKDIPTRIAWTDGTIVATHAGLTRRWGVRRFGHAWTGMTARHIADGLNRLSEHPGSLAALYMDDDGPLWARPGHGDYDDHLTQVSGHTPVPSAGNVEGVWLCDTFSTMPDGTPIGDRNILERGLDTLAVTSENLWGADGTPVEQGRKTNGNAARESVALS